MAAAAERQQLVLVRVPLRVVARRLKSNNASDAAFKAAAVAMVATAILGRPLLSCRPLFSSTASPCVPHLRTGTSASVDGGRYLDALTHFRSRSWPPSAARRRCAVSVQFYFHVFSELVRVEGETNSVF